jgi:hypothetical protein
MSDKREIYNWITKNPFKTILIIHIIEVAILLSAVILLT